MDETMIRVVSRHVIIAAAIVTAQPWVEAESLHKKWELRLDPLVKEPAPLSSVTPHTVNAIRFSTDEKWLAVVVGMHQIKGSFKSHLLIFDANIPDVVNQQFELERGVFPGQDDYPELLWSPDSDTIAVSGVIIPLRGRKPCSFDSWKVWLGGYLDNQNIVGRLTPASVDFEHPTSSFVTFSPQCERHDTWKVDDTWVIQDVSPDRGLALVKQANIHHVRLSDPPKDETLLVDFRRKQVLRRWPASELLPHQTRFAEGGKTLCAAGGMVGRDVVPVRCVDIESGNVIAEATSVKLGWSIVVASESSTAIIAQYRPDPSNRRMTAALERRVVWDFRKGQEITSWRPEIQNWRYPIDKVEQRRSNPFVAAISPTGKYIAEGGNGILRLYRVAP